MSITNKDVHWSDPDHQNPVHWSDPDHQIESSTMPALN